MTIFLPSLKKGSAFKCDFANFLPLLLAKIWEIREFYLNKQQNYLQND